LVINVIIIIILPKYFGMVTQKGSSLTLSAYGWWSREKILKPAEKIRQPESEDGSAEGVRRRNAEPSERQSPATPPGNFTSGTEQKFPFPF